MKGLDLWEVLGCAEMCAGVPLALQTPDPTWRLQDGIGIAPRGVPGHGAVGLAPHPALRAHSFVSCAGLGTAGTSWCVSPGSGEGQLCFEERSAPSWCLLSVLWVLSRLEELPEQREEPPAVIPSLPGPAPALI